MLPHHDERDALGCSQEWNRTRTSQLHGWAVQLKSIKHGVFFACFIMLCGLCILILWKDHSILLALCFSGGFMPRHRWNSWSALLASLPQKVTQPSSLDTLSFPKDFRCCGLLQGSPTASHVQWNANCFVVHFFQIWPFVSVRHV